MYAKKSNQKKRSAGHEPVLRTGALRSSARRGTARELAALRHPRLFALAGLRCSARSRRIPDQRQKRSLRSQGPARHGTTKHRRAAVALDLGSALSEPSIAGESGAKRCQCLVEPTVSRLTSAHRPLIHREAQGTDVRNTAARGSAACFFGYFLCTSKESDTSPQARKRPAGQRPALPALRHPQPFWLTATLPRINTPAINICTVTASPRNNHAKAAPNSGIR